MTREVLVARRTSLRLALVAAAVAAFPLHAPVRAGQVDHAADGVLRDWFGFDRSDLEDLNRRRAVVRSLDTVDGRELATVAAVRVRAPATVLAARLRGVESFAQSDVVLQIGTFGLPARAEDLRALRLEPELLRDLRRCHVHDCRIQLSAEGIRQIAGLPTGDTTAALTGVVQRLLAEMVDRYQQVGVAALMTYAGEERGQSVAAELDLMIGEPPRLLQRLPRLSRHLARFPRGKDDGIEDVLYWSRNRLGPATVLTVTHLAIARFDADGPVRYASVARQLYASRYFDASIGITLVLDRSHGSAAAADIVYLNRSRIDAFNGFVGRLKRAIARPRVRSGFQRGLRAARDQLERQLTDTERRAGARTRVIMGGGRSVSHDDGAAGREMLEARLRGVVRLCRGADPNVERYALVLESGTAGPLEPPQVPARQCSPNRHVIPTPLEHGADARHDTRPPQSARQLCGRHGTVGT